MKTIFHHEGYEDQEVRKNYSNTFVSFVVNDFFPCVVGYRCLALSFLRSILPGVLADHDID